MFKDRIIKERAKYIDEVRQASIAKKIIIYGAGTIGKMIFTVLHKAGLEIVGFCVTNKLFNKKQEFGVPIYTLTELKEMKNMLVLIAALEPTAYRMESVLHKMEDIVYMLPPQYVRFFDDDKYFRPCLEITPKVGCAVQCYYCPQEKFLAKYFAAKRPVELSLSDFKICIDKTPKDTIIEFAGFVEPFLHRETIEMMEYVRDTGREMTLFTTLLGVNCEKCKKILSLPFRQVVLHLPDRDRYANIPMTKEYFSVLDMVLDAKRLDGKSFVDSANCQSTPPESVIAFLQGRVMVSGVMIDRAGNLDDDNLRHATTNSDAIYCDRAYNLDHNILLPSGEVVLCCMDFGMKHVLGNLLEDSWEDIHSGTEMKKIQAEMRRSRCNNDVLCRYCTSSIIL
jgi:hypothetical protein